MPQAQRLYSFRNRIPGQAYLWFGMLIFGASSAVTRKITEIGAQHFMGGQNPISLCNVLFVGNLCALIALGMIHKHQWNRATLSQLSKKQWISLVIVAILAGAIAPAAIFQALALTPVNNIILVGRLEPPLTLALSVWILRERVNFWSVLGACVAFLGVVLTIMLQPAKATTMPMGSFGSIGIGELLAVVGAIALAISTIIGKKQLSQVPLGIYSVVRTALGTVIFFFVALIFYGHDHFAGVLSPFLWKWMLGYGVLIVVMGQSFWLTGLRASTIATASTIGSLTPIAGIFAAYLVLGEFPTFAQYVGGSVILLGICLSQIGIWRRPAPKVSAIALPAVQTEQEIESRMGFKGI